MEAIYHYYAFISYSTTDSKWAKWLQHQLSYYHIPSSVKKSKLGIPQKLRPIFIYEYDLAGNQLHKEIEKELNASKYLIVICSPESAKSIYVNREIEYFIKQGRQEYIIPFIIGGEVNSQEPSNECFPPALLKLVNSGGENEIRGIKISTNGKKQALVDVVATMLGVRKDILWNRYKKRLLKQRIMMALLVLLALLGCLFYWDYTRSTYEYYVDYVDKWGVPQGVLQLEKKDVKHRYGTYRFEYKRIPIGEPNFYDWRLHKVSYINSYGRPIAIEESEYTDRYPIQEFVYSPQDGNLTDIKFCDEKDKEMVSHKLSSKDGIKSCIADLENYGNDGRSGFSKNLTSINIDPTNETKSKIMRYVYERDNNGFIKKVTFHANNDPNVKNSKIPDLSGIWGIEYGLDSLGRRTDIRYLDYDGAPFSNTIGISSRQYKYDDKGIICDIKCYNLNRELTLNEYLWATAIAVSDEFGNRIEESYYDLDSNICFNKYGVAKTIFKYNNGKLIEQAFYNTENKLCFNDQGYAKIICKYDSKGNDIEFSFYNTEDELCLNESGYARCTLRYNSKGELIEQVYFDTDNMICFNNDGYAKIKFDYKNDCIIESFYDAEDSLYLNNYGFAKCIARYNHRGNIIEQTYYNEENILCLNVNGYAKVYAEYDYRGNCNKLLCYNAQNELDLNNFGYAKRITNYNYEENIIEHLYYNVGDSLCNNIDGFAKSIYKYDSRGNNIENSFYNTENELCLNSLGFAKVVYKYDSRGNCIEQFYYNIGKDKNIIGNGKVTYKYDSKGNCIEHSFYDVNDRLTINNIFGYAKVISEYDSRGNCLGQSYYDEDDSLSINNIFGYAKVTYQYDSRGNRIEEIYYKTKNELCLNNLGFAKIVSKYDSRRNLMEQSFYKTKNELCLNIFGFAKVSYRYDSRKNCIEKSYYNTKNELCSSNEGFAKCISKYDYPNKLVEISYHNIKDSLCLTSYGYAKMLIRCDDSGRPIESFKYDEYGNIIN